MHIKIAICDDDIKIQFSLEGFLQNILEEYSIQPEIECFDSGDALCDTYVKGKFDLIFLDIEFEGKIGSDLYQVALSEIKYFSSRARKVLLHGREKEAEFYGSLESICSQVKGKRFLYVHKSFLVNYQCIAKMEYEQVTLYDGTVIPISQARRPAIRKQFMDIKKGEMQ